MEPFAWREHPDFFADRGRVLAGNTDQDFTGRRLSGPGADRVRIALLRAHAVDVSLSADMFDCGYRQLEGEGALRRSRISNLEILGTYADHTVGGAGNVETRMASRHQVHRRRADE